MALEIWCLWGTAVVTALVAARVLATGRESVLMAEAEAAELEQALKRQREAVIAELERASSDVDPLHS